LGVRTYVETISNLKEMEDYNLSAPSWFRPKDSCDVLHGGVMRKGSAEPQQV